MVPDQAGVGRLVAVGLTALQIGCATPEPRASAGPGAQVTFDEHRIITGTAVRQTVLTGFFTGGATADVAVVEIDAENQRRLRVISMSGGVWDTTIETRLSPRIRFVDVIEIARRDRLVTYEPGQLMVFDLDRRNASRLLRVACSFEPPRANEVPHVDLSRDVNGDGRDDLVIPDRDGFWVSVQEAGGAFAPPLKVGPPTDLSRILGADGYRYDPWGQSRVFAIDWDGDALRDLVYWSGYDFAVHHGRADGRFSPGAEKFPTTVFFETDRVASLAEASAEASSFHSLADLNGDTVPDLVAYTLSGKSPRRKASSYGVHYGTRSQDRGIIFGADAGLTIASPGRVQLALEPVGADPRDPYALVMVTTIETRFLQGNPWKSLKGLMGDDVWLELEFYRRSAGVFPDVPNATRRVALDGAPSHREPGWVPLGLVLRGGTHEARNTGSRWPRSFNTHSLTGDVNGDGLTDLLVEPTFRGFDLFAGIPGPELLANQPQTVNVQLPNDVEYSWVTDLNRDGKSDLVLHDPFPSRDIHGGPVHPPGTEPQLVTLLFAR